MKYLKSIIPNFFMLIGIVFILTGFSNRNSNANYPPRYHLTTFDDNCVVYDAITGDLKCVNCLDICKEGDLRQLLRKVD